MPLYEYRCQWCGEDFEILAAMAQRLDGVSCPACGRHDVVRRFGSVNLGGTRTRFNPGTFVRPNMPGAKPRHSKT